MAAMSDQSSISTVCLCLCDILEDYGWLTIIELYLASIPLLFVSSVVGITQVRYANIIYKSTIFYNYT